MNVGPWLEERRRLLLLLLLLLLLQPAECCLPSFRSTREANPEETLAAGASAHQSSHQPHQSSLQPHQPEHQSEHQLVVASKVHAPPVRKVIHVTKPPDEEYQIYGIKKVQDYSDYYDDEEINDEIRRAEEERRQRAHEERIRALSHKKHSKCPPEQKDLCRNGGKCVARRSGYACNCATGWVGARCEVVWDAHLAAGSTGQRDWLNKSAEAKKNHDVSAGSAAASESKVVLSILGSLVFIGLVAVGCSVAYGKLVHRYRLSSTAHTRSSATTSTPGGTTNRYSTTLTLTANQLKRVEACVKNGMAMQAPRARAVDDDLATRPPATPNQLIRKPAIHINKMDETLDLQAGLMSFARLGERTAQADDCDTLMLTAIPPE